MFDEKTAIAEWRAGLAEAGTLFEADLDELESHLRDHLEALAEVGVTGEEAFRTAVERIGDTRVLADEFAKINPLLAWRAALFWICAGVMLVLGLLPVHGLAIHGAIAAVMSLELSPRWSSLLMWTVVFGSPLAFFAFVFPYARWRHVERPLPAAERPAVRVALIVGCVVLGLGAHLAFDWGLLVRKEWSYWGLDLHAGWATTEARLNDAWSAVDNAYYALAIAAPLFLFGVAARQRMLVLRDRAGAAPLFWLAVGLFVGSVRSALHGFVRYSALAAGARLHFRADQMSALLWIVTLACPLVLFASTYAYLRHRAPGPSRVLRARGVLVALLGSGAVSVAAVFATGSVAQRAYRGLPVDTIVAGTHGWLFAGIVTSCALPVIVGTIMLRLRNAASLGRT